MQSINRRCIICSNEDPPYNCPRCSKAYCSVTCCRQHKSDSSCKLSKEPIASFSGKDEETEYPTEDTVPIEKLQLLTHDKDLKSLLHNNDRLRRLLSRLDRSEDPSPLLKQAMTQDSDFQHFASICLKIADSDSDHSGIGPDDKTTVSQLLNSLRDAPRELTKETEAVAGFLSLLSEHLEDADGEIVSIFAKANCK